VDQVEKQVWQNTLFNNRKSCTDVSEKDVETIFLAGWAYRYRDQGGVVFIDLRDQWVLQVVLEQSTLGIN
jgi:aspartyl-tRNA synthetase